MQWVQNAWHWLVTNETFLFMIDALWKLALAALLGGAIGFEREHSHRPAGFRTHILVAVGAALVMLTSIYLVEMRGMVGDRRTDVSRLSAQVISGVGFLGAGTILREGFSVKGLTTAASLWAVACVGIAVGSGFVSGAIVATLLIYITLNCLKKLVVREQAGRALFIEVKGLEEQLPVISRIIKKTGTPIHSMEILYDAKRRKNRETTTVKALIFPKSAEVSQQIIAMLRESEDVVDVYIS